MSCTAADQKNRAEQTSAALLREVRQALDVLTELEPHLEPIGEATVQRMRDAVADIRRRLTRQEVFVCVVGEQKAGKSTFLNAVLGVPLLGTAVRECTGTVTYIRPGARPNYRARLDSGQWEEFGAVVPDQYDTFAAELSHLDEQLKHCDHIQATYPPQRDALQDKLQSLQTLLQEQTSQAEQIANETAELEACWQQQRDATDALGKQLKQSEHEVPWRYRRAGGWAATGHRVGRFLSRRPAQPRWETHLAEVARWEQACAAVSRQEADCESVRLRLQEQRQAVHQTKQEIATTATQRTEVCRTLETLPATRSELEQERVTKQQAWHAFCDEYFEQFRDAVKQLTDMNRRGQEVQELHLFVPTQCLPTGMVLIDTPGVNTTTEENQQRAWEAIQDHADACLLVSDLTQTVSESTREFVRKIRRVTPHLLLVLTKRDVVLRNAMLSGGDANEELAEAIQVGRSRFAAEVGRSEEEVLTFAVAAQPALQESLSGSPPGPASAAFSDELSRIFSVVEAERSLAISTKSASLLRKVHHESAATIAAAEQAYQQRIETLIQQRIGDPIAVSNQRISELVPQIRRLGEQISVQARDQLRDPLTEFRNESVQQISSAKDVQQLAKAFKWFQDALSPRLQQITQECRQQVDGQFSESLAALVNEARHPIHQRYQISQSVVAQAPQPTLSVQVLLPMASLSLTAQTKQVQDKIKRHVSSNQWLAMGIGRAAGQAVTAKGSGSAAGLAIGLGIGLARAAMQARKFPDLRASSAAKVEEMLDQLIAEASSEQALGPVAMERQLGSQLTRLVRQDIQHFQRWIEAVIQRQQQELNHQQQQLAHLRLQIDKLQQQDARLLTLFDQATAVCHGLCRQS